MKKRNPQWRLVCFLWGLCSLLVLPSLALAELHYFKMKGVDDQIKSEYRHLSPTSGGFNLLRLGILENLYRFGAPTERRVDGKLESVKDPLVQLIREMFHVPHGDQANFIPTQRPEMAAYYFSASTIGLVINQLAVKRKPEELAEVLKNPNMREDLENKLVHAMEKDIQRHWTQGTALAEKKKAQEALRDQALKELSAINLTKYIIEQNDLWDGKEEAKEAAVKIRKVVNTHRAHIREIKKTLALMNHYLPPEGKDKNGILMKDKEGNVVRKDKQGILKSWVRLLLRSIKDSQKQDSLYPKELPFQILLGYFWSHAEDNKMEIVHLFNPMSKVLKNPQVLELGLVQDQFLHAEYSRNDYVRIKAKYAKLTEDILAKHIAHHPEEAIFMARSYEMFDQGLPPLVRQDQAFVSNKPDGFSDCFEATIQNLSNVMFHTPETSRMDGIQRLEGKGVRFEFMDFYKSHPTLDNPYDQKRRNAWGELTTGISGMDYNKIGYDMNPSVSNLLKFYEYHLFQNDPHYPKAGKKSEKLTYLCNFLSPPEKELDWEIKGQKKTDIDKKNQHTGKENDTGFELVFSLNDEPAFSFKLSSDHAEPYDRLTSVQDWRKKVYPSLEKELSQAPVLKRLTLQAWYDSAALSKSTLEKVAAEEVDQFSYYFLPLRDNMTKLLVFKKIIESGNRRFYSLAHHLQKALPLDDLQAQQQIHSTLADNDHPFGVPPHAIGKPDAVYTRVSQAELTEKLGEEAAKKMGRTWQRTMHERPIAVGEPLLDENGKEMKVVFEKAKEECLKLNSEPLRAAVKNTFLTRELELDKTRKIPGLSEADREEKLRRIHTDMPIPGIYLMSKEEWKILEGDFGYSEIRYIPQILPKLYNRWFWSSSGDPNDARSAFTFNGSNGVFNSSYDFFGGSVRCGVEVAKFD